ncbi:MAG TPA: MFS transporter [Ktedonobacterales bacterium]|jgi:MFS family permease|nr:MFS transporter [Ktedonobacterales bacterium]
MHTDMPEAHSKGRGSAQPRSLWRNRDFLLLWSGQTVSIFGTYVSRLALPLLVLALTHSPAQAGLLTAVELLPYLLLSLPAGALVDRWNRKALMIWCDTMRLLALGSIPLAFALGHLTVAQLYVVAAVAGISDVFFGLAQISSLPQVVAPAQLPRAWSLSEASDASGRLLGPGLAGIIIGLSRTTVAGAALAYLADSISYLASVISLRFIRVPFQAERLVSGERPCLRREMVEGLRFLRKNRVLLLLALLTMSSNFFQAPITLAVIVLARDQLHIDVQTLGLMFSAGGLGALVGATLAPKGKEQLRFGFIIVGGLALWTLAAVLLALAGSPPPLVASLTLVQFVWPFYGVAVVTYRFSLVPDELQGRVTSAFRVLTFGAEPLGAALGGVLLAALGARPVLWLIAAGVGLTALLAAISPVRKI